MSRRLDPSDAVKPSPKASGAKAYWGVGVVAAIGFAIGVAFPQVAELRLAPRPPTSETDKGRGSGREKPVRRSHDGPAMTGRVEALVAETTVHDAPNSKTVVDRLSKGTKVLIEDDKGDWLLVRHGPEERGWIVRTAITGPGS